MGPSFPEIPMAEPYKYSPWLRPRNEGPPAAASEAARVQPFKCSQQVKLGFRSASAPLRDGDGDGGGGGGGGGGDGGERRGPGIPRREPPGRSPLSLRRGSGPVPVAS
jgi:hypothetical protein